MDLVRCSSCSTGEIRVISYALQFVRLDVRILQCDKMGIVVV